MKDNDKDIKKIFSKLHGMNMDPERKRQIKMSILKEVPAPSQSMFSWWAFAKMGTATLVLLLIVVSVVSDDDSGIIPSPHNITEELVMESNGLDGEVTNSDGVMLSRKSFGTEPSADSGLGGGLSPEISMFAAGSLSAPEKRGSIIKDGIEFSTQGFLDGFNKNEEITITVSATNISGDTKEMVFNNGCQTYTIVDGVDSRSDQFCIQVIGGPAIAPGETYTWQVVISPTEMDLGFGTHKVTVGVEGYYEYTQEVVLE